MKNQIMIGLTAIGLLAGCASSKVQYSDLPSPVQNTLQTQCRNAQVAKIEQDKRDGCCVYKVEFGSPCAHSHAKVYIRPDGTIVD
ncbi:MAG: hypothetical protein ACXWKG_14685 [Limisphaerales bacterium]